MSVSPARRIALEVLTAVRERDAYANLMLPVVLDRVRPSPADAAFATELTYGTLRLLGRYDAIIGSAARRQATAIDPSVLDVLRLGAHQLLATRTAPHAAVHQAVEQVRQVAGPRPAGFANAVLRRIGERDGAAWTALLTDGLADPAEREAVATGHPVWIVQELQRALEETVGAEELGLLLDADDEAPPVNLVALPGLADRAAVQRADERVHPHPLAPYGLVLAGGDPRTVPGVAEGTVRVQDPGSQMAALALVRARPVQPGERWLDLCAGPGGKAALLAAEARIGGASLVANEVVPARAALVERALAAVPGDHAVEVGDGRRFGADGRRFDRILLDAPCSGLGALRRRPEARWRKQPSDLPPLAVLQGELLDAAIAALAPGGLLAYVTCSPVAAETSDVLAAAHDRHDGLVAEWTLSAMDLVAGAMLSDVQRDDSAVQLWPHRHGTDAMFVQLLSVR